MRPPPTTHRNTTVHDDSPHTHIRHMTIPRTGLSTHGTSQFRDEILGPRSKLVFLSPPCSKSTSLRLAPLHVGTRPRRGHAVTGTWDLHTYKIHESSPSARDSLFHLDGEGDRRCSDAKLTEERGRLWPAHALGHRAVAKQ
jgi:hypothetical protein